MRKHIEITEIEGGFLVRYDRPDAFAYPFMPSAGIREVVITDLTEIEQLVHWLYCKRAGCEWCEERSTPECEIIHEARAASQPEQRPAAAPWPVDPAVPMSAHRVTLGRVLTAEELFKALNDGAARGGKTGALRTLINLDEPEDDEPEDAPELITDSFPVLDPDGHGLKRPLIF